MRTFPHQVSILIILLSMANLILTQGNSSQVGCELVASDNFFTIDVLKTCFMNETTVISSPSTLINNNKDETIKELNFYRNTKIEYLPIFIYKSFPNATVIIAQFCSIRSIEFRNFELLDELTHLYLSDNQISTVPDNTFQSLTSLRDLDLSEKVFGKFTVI